MLSLRCACGSVRGQIPSASDRTVLRLVCYCHDCQAYLRFLSPEAPGYDDQGGTDILQTSQAAVQFSQGADQLEVMKLSDSGILRWYARCCRTPVGNMMQSTAFCFVGMHHAFVEGDATATVGPSRGAVNGNEALGDPKPTIGAPKLVSIIGASIWNGIVWRARGDHLRSPFRGPDGAVLREPQVLDPSEREALR